MRLTVVLDHRFYRLANAEIGSLTTFGLDFWERYLRVFSRLRIICRVRDCAGDIEGIAPIRDPRIEFLPVSYYEGFSGFLRALPKIRSLFLDQLREGEAYILRVPQLLPNVAHSVLRKRKIPFGVEVVADPWDLYAPGAERHPLRPIIRRYTSRKLRMICANACASSYVTREKLQHRYPPRAGTLSVHASSIVLREVETSPRQFSSMEAGPFKILFVGTLNRLYKGQDVLLEALAKCVHEYNLDVQLRIVGDGNFRTFLKNLCEKLDIAQRVMFLGALPQGGAVMEEMRHADLFVLPSRQEGLPRAIIEAMSVGLPCLSTDVGGICELLESSCIVRRDCPGQLAGKIAEVCENRARLSEMSERNLVTAREYTEKEVQPRRDAFYAAVGNAVRGGRF